MSLLTIAQARTQCRLPADYPVEQLEPCVAAAQSIAEGYLCRALYADDQALENARDAIPQAMREAAEAYAQAVAVAEAMDHAAQKQAALALADARLSEATRRSQYTLLGMAVNDAIEAAMLLIVGHLFSNRADVVQGQVAALPMGAHDLLRPYRRVMMP